jgi:alpha-beta hydrolase superfamily lysophospholipase
MGGCASEDPGVADVLAQLRTKSKACPNQKYALGGHSQGGVVIQRAIPHIEKDILARVVAVTGVGSPPCASEVKEKCRVYCNSGDSVRQTLN